MREARHGAWVDGDATPEDGGRAGGLAGWCEAADDRLEREAYEVTRRVVALDACAAMARGGFRRCRSPVEAVVYVVLGLVAWRSARWLAGVPVDEDDVAAAMRVRRALPFGGTRDVLRAAQATPVLGVGDVSLQLAEDRDETRGQKARGKVGIDYAYSNPTRPAAHQPRGTGAVDRHLDAVLALRRSGLPEHEVALLALADVGTPRGKARRTKHGVEEAVSRPDVAELAAALGVSERELRGRVARARRLLGVELEASGLAPAPARRRGDVRPAAEPVAPFIGAPLPGVL